jgi:hypothetical protein
MPTPLISDNSTKNSFVFRLVTGCIITNLFVFFLVGLSIYNSRQQYDTLAEIMTQNIAKTLEAGISGVFDKCDVGLSAVVRETERQLAAGGIRKNDLNTYTNVQLAQLPELARLLVADTEGNLLYGTDIPAGKPVNIGDRDYFQRLRANPKEGLALSKLLRGRVSGKWNIIFSRRINHPDGSFAGVVTGSFDASHFDTLFSQLDIGKRGAIGIRDTDFALVALHPKGKEPGSQIGAKVVSQKTRDLIQANRETATYKTVFARDNKERVVTFRKAAKYPFYIFATSAPSDYLAPWRRETVIALTLLGIFTLATLFALRMMLRSRSAEQSREEAERINDIVRRENQELNAAISRIKQLEGIISICMYCKKIRTEQDSWAQLETYLTEHTNAMFSHGACPQCAEEQMNNFRNMK